MRTRIALISVVLLAVAACGGEPSATSTSPLDGSTTVTAAPPTTAAPTTAVPTTTLAPGTTIPPSTSQVTSTTGPPYVVPGTPELTPPDPLNGSEGASGSGCAPGTDDLPSGIWFGFLVERSDSAVELDLACFYFGDIAWEKAAEVGQEANNDYWIVNENPLVRTVPVAGDAAVWAITGDATLGHERLAYADWTGAESTYTPCPGEGCTVWLYVNDGVVDEIVEQYLP